MKNNKVIILVIIFAVYILLLTAPALISHLISGLGPFFPILVFILIANAKNGRNRFRNWFTEYEPEDRGNVWEDNRDETERLGREIHDQAAVLKKLYDIHYSVLEDHLFERYHNAIYRVQRGECSEDLLLELRSLVKALSMYEDPYYREEQKRKRQGTGAGPQNYQRGPAYQSTLFHPFLGKTKHFRDCEDFDSAKRKYYKLMKETHPDNSQADAELCAELNSEFDSIQNYFHRK